MKALGVLFLILLIVALIALGFLLTRGLSTRGEPTVTEVAIARTVRHLATPMALRNVRNPIPLSDAVLADGRGHWADHCAGCHGNDGSGQTEIGRNLYPKAPDMRKPRTQGLTDGELFSIIKNGVRLTGMPAWGDAEGHDDRDNWKLVHFIRHLPKITPAELQQMKAMNPMSPGELKEQQQEDEFLKGK